MMLQLLALDPKSYSRHRLHEQERDWAETNCYTDLCIELLHALGHEPLAALPFTLAIDFEGDQWTFFKYPPEDIRDLYGLEVYELALWRPLTQHIAEQLTMGRPVLVELDSFYLPDTAGSAYQLAHVKTTVAVNQLDLANEELGYFHNQGYFHLRGDDFRSIFHLHGTKNPAILPPYCEVVRRAAIGLESEALLSASLGLLKKHLARVPDQNPFEKYRPRFEQDLAWLMSEPLETFHLYSFATLRQFGACYELSANYFKWLQFQGIGRLDEPIEDFTALSLAAKTFQFQLARAVARKRPIDLAPLTQMADHWLHAMDVLQNRFFS